MRFNILQCLMICKSVDLKDNKDMSHIRAVLFDCDGTLVDSEHTRYLAWKYAMQELGGDLEALEYWQYSGKSAETISRKLSARTSGTAEEIIASMRKHYKVLSKNGFSPIAPTVDFLKTLAAKKDVLGIRLGVCSAAHREDTLFHLHHLGIAPLLDVVLSGHEDLTEYSDPEGVNKPKPYIYLHAMKLLHVLPQQTIVIEDSGAGVSAGVSAGCFTIAIPNEYTRWQDLSHSHLSLESFSGMDIEQFFKLTVL